MVPANTGDNGNTDICPTGGLPVAFSTSVGASRQSRRFTALQPEDEREGEGISKAHGSVRLPASTP